MYVNRTAKAVVISIHALLAESDLKWCTCLLLISLFLSTLSLRRATNARPDTRQPDAISIHALLAESDFLSIFRPVLAFYFYPRSPCGERRKKSPLMCSMRHFYPRSPCGERHDTPSISTPKPDFYPRSPCGERPPIREIIQWEGIFLSTLSLRRATNDSRRWTYQRDDFYPRSPCGERLSTRTDTVNSFGISIHALLAESDCITTTTTCIVSKFLSTLSLRRATAN